MLAEPVFGLSATISVRGEAARVAAARVAAAPIFAVIEAVVFGLSTRMRIGGLKRRRRDRRP